MRLFSTATNLYEYPSPRYIKHDLGFLPEQDGWYTTQDGHFYVEKVDHGAIQSFSVWFWKENPRLILASMLGMPVTDVRC